MSSEFSKRLKESVGTVVTEVDINDAWLRGLRRRKLRFAVMLGATLMAAIAVFVAANTVMGRLTGDDRIEPMGGGGMATTTQSPQPECGERSEESYGTTEIGQWLSGLMIQVGAPQEGDVDASEVRDTGTALQIEGDAYGNSLVVYVSAQKPPDPDFSPDSAEPVTQFEDFTIYYNEGPAWKSFVAINNEWQLSLIGYPGPEARSVPWTPNSKEISDWFSQALGEAKQDPPPCS